MIDLARPPTARVTHSREERSIFLGKGRRRANLASRLWFVTTLFVTILWITSGFGWCGCIGSKQFVRFAWYVPRRYVDQYLVA